MIYADMLGMQIGEVTEQGPAIKNKRWIEVKFSKIEPFDVLLFRNNSLGRHVGMAIDESRMIHTDEGIDSCIENYTSATWKHRLKAAYRHSLLS